MGLGSRGFLPLTRKLPQIVVQRGSPHDLSRSAQNEVDFACVSLFPADAVIGPFSTNVRRRDHDMNSYYNYINCW